MLLVPTVSVSSVFHWYVCKHSRELVRKSARFCAFECNDSKIVWKNVRYLYQSVRCSPSLILLDVDITGL